MTLILEGWKATSRNLSVRKVPLDISAVPHGAALGRSHIYHQRMQSQRGAARARRALFTRADG